jgi:hypothetical protein
MSGYFGAFHPTRGGSDLTYSAIASRSAGASCEVLRTTSTMFEPTESPLGVRPVDSTSAMSPFDQSPMPVLSGVMFGTEPLPSGLGPPA